MVVAVVVTAVVAPAQCSLRRNTLEQLVLVRHRVGYVAMALTYCECPHSPRHLRSSRLALPIPQD